VEPFEGPVEVGQVGKAGGKGDRCNVPVRPSRIDKQAMLVVPLLQRFLNIEELKAAQDVYAFHVPLFRKVPSPLLTGTPKLQEFLEKTYSGADALKEADIADRSFTDDLEKTGFIDRLYAT
jgi:hypothetical protein